MGLVFILGLTRPYAQFDFFQNTFQRKERNPKRCIMTYFMIIVILKKAILANAASQMEK